MAILFNTGTYTGTGALASITGVGFQPKVVIIFSPMTTAVAQAAGAVWKSADMPALIAAHWGENGEFPGITSLDADGFSLAILDYANKSGETYYWVAFAGDDVVTGSYMGDGVDNRSITGVGFQPIWVMLQGGGNHTFHKMDSTGAAVNISQYGANVSNLANVIQALEADGFMVGSTPSANDALVTYYYVAFKASASIYNFSYVGDASDNKAISGFGFSPSYILVKSAGVLDARHRTLDVAGDNTGRTVTNSGFVADNIQSFDADGITIGTVINDGGTTFHAIAFGTPTPPATNTRKNYGYAGDGYGIG